MRYRAIPTNDLTADQLQAWGRLQQADATTDSPFFRPEFSTLTGAVRDGCEVAVMEQDGQPVGFLPFCRETSRLAYSVADTLTDFQGAVVSPTADWDVRQLVRDCGLKTLHLDHILATQSAFRPYHWYEVPSPYIDLSDGFDAYQIEQGKRSNLIRQTLRKLRKLEREVGPLRLEFHCTDRLVFQQLLEWKTGQYQGSGARNVLDQEWTVELLERVLGEQSALFAGKLSALYAGDQLCAVHLGLLSQHVFHWWFPAYNPQLQRYSPGLIQLLEIARVANGLGVRRIDLGKGSERYKSSFMTGATLLADGSVDLRPVARNVRRAWLQATDYVRTSPLRRPAQFLVHQCGRLLNPRRPMAREGQGK